MNDAQPVDFPARLRKLRKRREFSQAQLAERVGIHFTQISRYERGETKPAATAAAALARELETTVDYLMSGTTDNAAATAGLERELVARLRQVQDLPTEEKRTVLSLLDAFVAKSKIQGFLSN